MTDEISETSGSGPVESTSATVATPTPLPPKIEVDRQHALTTVRAAIETVQGVIPVPAGKIGLRNADPYPVSIDIGRSSISVRVSVGIRYPNDLVSVTDNLRSSINEALLKNDNAPTRRVDITVAHLELEEVAK